MCTSGDTRELQHRVENKEYFLSFLLVLTTNLCFPYPAQADNNCFISEGQLGLLPDVERKGKMKGRWLTPVDGWQCCPQKWRKMSLFSPVVGQSPLWKIHVTPTVTSALLQICTYFFVLMQAAHLMGRSDPTQVERINPKSPSNKTEGQPGSPAQLVGCRCGWEIWARRAWHSLELKPLKFIQ